MEIKQLQEEQIGEAVQLARGVYEHCIRPHMTDLELVHIFLQYSKEETVRQNVRDGRLVLFGAFENGSMIGMSGMQQEGHITMLYVLPAFQRRGCGRQLLERMRQYGGTENRTDRVTLSAAPAWTAGYFAKRGFRQMDLLQPADFVWMQARRSPCLAYETKEIPTPVLLGTALGGLAVCIAIAVGYMVSVLGTF